jgi:hypothetical protein
MWTPDKKVGDEVAIHVGGSWHGRWELRTIVGETATQWILSGSGKVRVRKDRGKIVGADFEYADDATKEMRAQIAEHDKWARISRKATEIKHRLDELYRTGDEGREWIVNNIGPLMPKEQKGDD